MPIKTLGSLGKIRVGRVTGNTHIFFFGLIVSFFSFNGELKIPQLSLNAHHYKVLVLYLHKKGQAVIYLLFKIK